MNATDDTAWPHSTTRFKAETRIASPCCSRTALMSTKLAIGNTDDIAVHHEHKKIIEMLKQAGG